MIVPPQKYVGNRVDPAALYSPATRQRIAELEERARRDEFVFLREELQELRTLVAAIVRQAGGELRVGKIHVQVCQQDYGFTVEAADYDRCWILRSTED
jgi:alpha-D-ribose 1-methylphosphonate 5-triphosphate synthase subunit PhnI